MRILGVVAVVILLVPSVIVGTGSVLERLSGPAAKAVVRLAENALPKLGPSDFTVGARWRAPERVDFVHACVHSKLKADAFPTGAANIDGSCECIADAATSTTSHADRLILRYGFTQNRLALDELALAMQKAGHGSNAINEASQRLQAVVLRCASARL